MARRPAPLAVVQDVCCDPLATVPLGAEEAQVLAARMKAVADPARLRVLSLLMTAEAHEACTCDLTGPLGLAQPTVSHHLKKLAEAGLVVGERRGVWTYYRAVPEALRELAGVLMPTP